MFVTYVTELSGAAKETKASCLDLAFDGGGC